MSRPAKSNIQRVPLFLVSRFTANEWVYARMKVRAVGPNYMHFPNDPGRGYGMVFFRKLTAERLVVRRERGVRKEVWIDDGKASEALSCRRAAAAAMLRLNADFEVMARQAELSSAEGEAERKGSRDQGIEGSGSRETAACSMWKGRPLRGGVRWRAVGRMLAAGLWGGW